MTRFVQPDFRPDYRGYVTAVNEEVRLSRLGVSEPVTKDVFAKADLLSPCRYVWLNYTIWRDYMFDGADIVLEGIWYYDTIPCKIRIIKWNTIYGTGDYEDEPEERDDKIMDCYYALFDSPLNKGDFKSSTVGFLSVDELKNEVEMITRQKISWIG